MRMNILKYIKNIKHIKGIFYVETEVDAMKYVCSKTKEDIIDIVVSEFNRVQADYDMAMETGNKMLQERNQGRYVAMFDLLHKLEIYEKYTNL